MCYSEVERDFKIARFFGVFDITRGRREEDGCIVSWRVCFLVTSMNQTQKCNLFCLVWIVQSFLVFLNVLSNEFFKEKQESRLTFCSDAI